MNRLPVRRTDVAWVEIDGDVVVVDSRCGDVHRLEGAAAVIWLLLDGGPLDDLPTVLSEHFEVEPAQAALDLTEALELIVDAGLVGQREE